MIKSKTRVTHNGEIKREKCDIKLLVLSMYFIHNFVFDWSDGPKFKTETVNNSHTGTLPTNQLNTKLRDSSLPLGKMETS